MSRVECTACERGEPEKCTTWAQERDEYGSHWVRCAHLSSVHVSGDGSAFDTRRAS